MTTMTTWWKVYLDVELQPAPPHFSRKMDKRACWPQLQQAVLKPGKYSIPIRNRILNIYLEEGDYFPHIKILGELPELPQLILMSSLKILQVKVSAEIEDPAGLVEPGEYRYSEKVYAVINRNQGKLLSLELISDTLSEALKFYRLLRSGSAGAYMVNSYEKVRRCFIEEEQEATPAPPSYFCIDSLPPAPAVEREPVSEPVLVQKKTVIGQAMELSPGQSSLETVKKIKIIKENKEAEECFFGKGNGI